MLEYKPQEELIALIKRYEQELAAERAEVAKLRTTVADLQSRMGGLINEKAEAAPCKPAETVDTPEFRRVLRMWRELQNGDDDGNFLRIIYHADSYTARAVAAADKAARQNLARVLGLGVSEPRSFAWDYLFTIVAAALEDQPVQQPAAVGDDQLNNEFHKAWLRMWGEQNGGAHYTYRDRDCWKDGYKVGTSYTAPVPAAGVQGDKQTDLARRLLFKANDTSGNQISVMKADLIAICCEANRYYIGMQNWKATAEAKDMQSKPDSGRDAALDDAAIKAFFNARDFYPENIQRQSAFFDSVRELIAQHAAHPANGAQSEINAALDRADAEDADRYPDGVVLEQAAQACDQQADGTNGPYRSACLACASAVRELRDSAAAPQKKEG